VRVFSGAGGQQLPGTIGSFFAYAPDMTRGVRVGSVDANGDGKSDILAATGPGGPFEVRLFDAVAGPQQSNFGAAGIPTGGAFVAGADQQSHSTTPFSGAPLLAARGLAAVPSIPASLSSEQLDPIISAALEDLHGEGHESERLSDLLDVELQSGLLPELVDALFAEQESP
jgi:hypothetical protein